MSSAFSNNKKHRGFSTLKNFLHWNLTFYIELLGHGRCCSAVEFGRAGDFAVVFLLPRNERQDGLHFTVAQMAYPWHLGDLIDLAPAPCEVRQIGGAGVGD